MRILCALMMLLGLVLGALMLLSVMMGFPVIAGTVGAFTFWVIGYAFACMIEKCE